MKIKNLFIVMLSLFITNSCCWFSNCSEPENCPSSISFNSILKAKYVNPIDSLPSLKLDLSSSSKDINIESSPIIKKIDGRILINYPAVSIKNGQDVYKIKEISTERLTADCWIVDEENKLTWDFSKSLDIVLVLDVSSSLEDNIAEIKNSASNVINNIFNQNNSAKVAVVKFSRGSVNHGFSSSIESLTSFVKDNSKFTSTDLGEYELEGRNETGLYEAVSLAIEMLNSSDARGKGILTFTDGVNNFHFNPENQLPNNIISKMNESGIANYTIGFDGNQGRVDRLSLERISVNGDYSFPKSTGELNLVFEKFSNNVATVYDLIYNTNSSNLVEPINYRFLFKTVKVN